MYVYTNVGRYVNTLIDKINSTWIKAEIDEKVKTWENDYVSEVRKRNVNKRNNINRKKNKKEVFSPRLLAWSSKQKRKILSYAFYLAKRRTPHCNSCKIAIGHFQNQILMCNLMDLVINHEEKKKISKMVWNKTSRKGNHDA